jgi:cyclophilin family peptidyl-prolyl cis-trans isomerase
MSAILRASLLAALAMPFLSSCQTREDKERELTTQCKTDAPCKKQGLCTGVCSPEPCRCVVGSNSDCAASSVCASAGQCTAKDGKCVVASNTDCAQATPCKTAGLCTAKEGICVVATDTDCGQSDLCKNHHRCKARDSACVDASFVPALLNPGLTNEQAPEKFKVKFTTQKGDFVVEVTKAWAPLGADRLYNLVKIGYYNNVAFFKADASEVDFGIHGNPDVSAAWRDAAMRDDPPKQPNERGYVAFGKGGPNTRWAPLVIHLKDRRELSQVGYAPVGKVVQGMNVVDSLNKNDAAPPDPVKVQTGGESYLKASYPTLDYVTGVSLL